MPPSQTSASNDTTTILNSHNTVTLTRDQLSPQCGCLAKLPGVELGKVLDHALGTDRAHDMDDCAILRIPALDMLASVDLGPLVGPDVFQAGRIAGFHAMSDVYAMGGTPLYALAIVMADPTLPNDTTASVMAGMASACTEEGVRLVGGHTIIGGEALAGLTVIGSADSPMLLKRGAQPGQVLMVSKPLGTGMILRAFRQGIAGIEALESALSVMNSSNRGAAMAAVANSASALTDVTGFGLLGHLAEMLAPDGLGATIHANQVPVIAEVRSLPQAFGHSFYLDQNLEYARSLVKITGIRDRSVIGHLLDPQTSGGLLATVNPDRVEQMGSAGFRTIGAITTTNELEIRA